MSQNKTLLALAVLIAFNFTPKHVYAQEDTDAYDPFIDYSEYEEAGDEEADINFFRNGRFLTIGLNVGERMFTGGMSDIYKNDIGFGVYLSYFFDLRFALQFGYFTSTNGVVLQDTSNVKYPGTANISSISADIKYYLNTQNVTKGLAAINPYMIFGLSSIKRNVSAEGIADFASDDAIAFDAGGGVEFPLMRNKMYFGAQALYQAVSFADEHRKQGNQTPDGDLLLLSAIIGVNF